MSSLFPSCAETARRLSESQESPLPFGVRCGVTLHLAMCRLCRRYRHQLKFLRKAFRRMTSEIEAPRNGELCPRVRQRIIDTLEGPD